MKDLIIGFGFASLIFFDVGTIILCENGYARDLPPVAIWFAYTSIAFVMAMLAAVVVMVALESDKG